MSALDTAFAVESLRRCPLFAFVDEETIGRIAGQLRLRRFRRNEVVFHQGDPGDALHIIASGSVKILLPSSEGEQAIIATLRSGDFFGELSILDGRPRSATATAVEPAETYSLTRDAFTALLGDSPALRDALLTGLAGELRRLTGHVEELHFLDLAGRLALRLVRLARDADPEGHGSVTLDWPYTQSDLAAMIGGTRQSVNRLVTALTGDGLVRIEGAKLIVEDLERLEQRAAW